MTRCSGEILSNIVFEPALLELTNKLIKNKRNFSKDIEQIMLKDKSYIIVKSNYKKLSAEVSLLEEKLKELDKELTSFNEALKGQIKAKLKALLIKRAENYKLLATSYNIEAFIKDKRALLDKFNSPINNIIEFPFRELFSRATVISLSEVVFHLGFIDHNIKKETYLEGELPYTFRAQNKIFKYYLVV